MADFSTSTFNIKMEVNINITYLLNSGFEIDLLVLLAKAPCLLYCKGDSQIIYSIRTVGIEGQDSRSS